MTSNIVKFIYKNKIFEIKNPNSNETILNFVRTNLKKTGTKEDVPREDVAHVL